MSPSPRNSTVRSPEAQSTGARILVVSDQSKLRCSLRDLLQVYSYLCFSATCVTSATALLERQAVELVLIDLEETTEIERLLKRLRNCSHAPQIVVCSSQSSPAFSSRTLQLGAQHVIHKPYAPTELIQLIQSHTEHRQLEAQMAAMHRQLRDSEQRHRFFVDNSPDIIYMLDHSGCFSFINARASSLLGYPDGYLIGRHFSEILHPADFARVAFSFTERRTGQRATHSMECRLLHWRAANETGPDPSPLTIELTAMGVYSDASVTGEPSFVGTYGVARDISRRKRAEAQVQFQLSHDLLTGLPNRGLFLDRLQHALSQAQRSRAGLAVMYLDLDRFKVINDSLGHQMGDQLLQQVALRMRSCLRESDTLARVGGDEFNLLLPGPATEQDALTTAAKILKALEAPIELDGATIYASSSIGVALYPRDGSSAEQLIRHADIAMYQVKQSGKNNVRCYAPGMQTLHARHLTLENGLRRALDEDQLRLFFQPQRDTHSGEVTGVEALLRWEHPEQGLVLPGEFIRLSEESGLIGPMGRWVLDHACQVLADWHLHGLRDLTLAVNVSARELLQPDFTNQVLDAIARHRINPAQLELEITEHVLMQDMEHAVAKLKVLAEQGVRVAVDDFGTGYSSLSYLQRLPLDTLKVDRSFIRSVQSAEERNAIVTAIVAMARELDLNLVAEGVESEAQLQYLRNLGCPKAQGFLLGRPLPADQLLRQLIA